ncbi:MAG TPA: YdeI/OmpD-associated family protein [Terriglobales bacterium]|jgi:uncharacterized protein YdeI (YjbR/CyaY-like superfamily)|nr:YdeI/OmpD-associated family protein [Terriglobales bacterium]
MKPNFFATPSDLRAWLARNHDKTKELWVGFYKKNAGKPTITWPEAVDAALCFGWIDGFRKSIDEISYTIRLTPRKPGSTWSAININKVQELTKQGLMHATGLAAFRTRVKEKSGIYSYEQRRNVKLDPLYEKKIRANKKAHQFFRAQPPWYQRTAIYWVMSAKKEETRQKRLATLIACSQDAQAIKPLTRPAASGPRNHSDQ